MARRKCERHGRDYPCSCAMGNLYRFVEPVVLFLLKKRGRAHGYELAGELGQYALTDAEIERAALYRTLRQLEQNGNVVSAWHVAGHGPARRVYKLTRAGEQHLDEWIEVLGHISRSMGRFLRAARAFRSEQRSVREASSPAGPRTTRRRAAGRLRAAARSD